MPSDWDETADFPLKTSDAFWMPARSSHDPDNAFQNAARAVVEQVLHIREANRHLQESKAKGETTMEDHTRVPGSRVPAAHEQAAPKCKVHRKFMVYNAAEDRMECVETGCDRYAEKTRNFRAAVGGPIGGKPAVYRGSLDFVVDKDGELYLYLPEANAVISLFGIQNAEIASDDPATASKQMRAIRYIASLFEAAEQQVELDKRRAEKAAETDAIEERYRQRQQMYSQPDEDLHSRIHARRKQMAERRAAADDQWYIDPSAKQASIQPRDDGSYIYDKKSRWR